ALAIARTHPRSGPEMRVRPLTSSRRISLATAAPGTGAVRAFGAGEEAGASFARTRRVPRARERAGPSLAVALGSRRAPDEAAAACARAGAAPGALLHAAAEGAVAGPIDAHPAAAVAARAGALAGQALVGGTELLGPE